uniref:Ig-like domain-containing protein n=1 Tax=Cyclopterus lumpus TaxID=8103 RepID=A0A8C3A6N2_CYCLU
MSFTSTQRHQLSRAWPSSARSGTSRPRPERRFCLSVTSSGQRTSTWTEEVTSCGKLKVIPSIEPLFTRKLDVLEVIEGRNARFDCKVSGTPSPKVIWSHFDHPLIESEDIRVLREGGRHSLFISHVTNEDEGFYTVTACNSHGEAESSAELYIQEPRPAISSQM